MGVKQQGLGGGAVKRLLQFIRPQGVCGQGVVTTLEASVGWVEDDQNGQDENGHACTCTKLHACAPCQSAVHSTQTSCHSSPHSLKLAATWVRLGGGRSSLVCKYPPATSPWSIMAQVLRPYLNTRCRTSLGRPAQQNPPHRPTCTARPAPPRLHPGPRQARQASVLCPSDGSMPNTCACSPPQIPHWLAPAVI